MRVKLMPSLVCSMALVLCFAVSSERRGQLSIEGIIAPNPGLSASDEALLQRWREENGLLLALPTPQILNRQAWKAKDPIGEMNHHSPVRITIHHSASRRNINIPLEQKMRDLQSFSQHPSHLSTGLSKPEWPDVPYHFYISGEGEIAEGRDIRYAGDTNTEYDPVGHILVVLEGNFETEQLLPKQFQSLCYLVSWLTAHWQIPITEIKGHKDYAATACPGMNLEKEIPRLRKCVAENIANLQKK